MRHLLLVTAYWPPRADSGTHRWAGIAPPLVDHGWRPVVLTPSVPWGDELDLVQAGAVGGIEVWRPPPRWSLGRPSASYQRRRVDLWPDTWRHDLLGALRRGLVFPDGAAGWVPGAVRYGDRRGEQRRFDAVISSGPPSSVHLVGGALAHRFGCRWVADHRDLWCFSSRLAPVGPIKGLHRVFRQQVMTRADGHLAASSSIAKALVGHGARRVAVVRNGADVRQQGFGRPRGATLRIAHVGVLHRDRHQPALWAGLAAALRSGQLDRDTLEVELVGPCAADVNAAVTTEGLGPWVRLAGVLGHDDALAAMQRADVLLLLGAQDPRARDQVPAKLYEYLMSGALVVGAVDDQSEPASLLREAGHWVVGASPTASAWQGIFERIAARFVAGEREVPVSPSVAEAVDHRRLAAQVAAHLVSIVDG